MKWLGACGLAVGLALVAGGCKERPRPAEEAPRRAAPASRPTTRELAEAPERRLGLRVLPLSLEAPESWDVKVEDSLVLLQGPGSHEDVRVQLAHHPGTSGDALVALGAGAEREMRESPETIKVATLRDRGNMKVLERQSIGRSFMATTTDSHGQSQARPVVRYNWTITAFVPHGREYDTYELNFMGLSQEEFQADEAFLRRMIDSMQYDPTAVQR